MVLVLHDCWVKCQDLSREYDNNNNNNSERDNNNDSNDDNEFGGVVKSWSREEDLKRLLTANASPRRRCIDGVRINNNNNNGCFHEAAMTDPPIEKGGHELSLPYLLRVIYQDDINNSSSNNSSNNNTGDALPRFILILREPGE